MAEQKIKATDIERQYLARRIREANATEAMALEVFTMFCEGHGITGAKFVGIDGDSVIVSVPEKEATKPQLAKEA